MRSTSVTRCHGDVCFTTLEDLGKQGLEEDVEERWPKSLQDRSDLQEVTRYLLITMDPATGCSGL